MTGPKKGLHMITFILLVVGGLNWLAYGLFEKEIGALIGGMNMNAAKVIYILVGLAAIFEIVTHGSRCKECKPESQGGGMMGGGM